MSDSILNVSELDFDTIKTNLKNFLRTKTEFTDYDFEGSGLSVLIDVLSYNTHYEAMVANQLAQELTIDTARNRRIVGLHAKRLGYLPRSYRAARTTVNLEVVNPSNGPATLTLGKGASFISTVDGSVIEFTNRTPKTISRDVNGRYIFNNIEIFEGELKTFRYAVSDPSGKFEIPDDTVDTSTLRVFVQTSLTNTAQTEYFKADRITGIGSDSLAYFIQMNQKGKYEIHFGDGIIGKLPSVGNVVVLEYIVTNGSSGNDISVFSFNDYVEGNANIALTTNSKSFGGDEFESIESVRFNAYKNNMTQDRAVTANDYANLIASLFPLDAISVWGGEQNDPPVYGKVFIAIKPIDSDSVLTDTHKNFISQTLRASKSIVTVSPEFVDVDYLFIEPTIVAYIDDTKLNTTQEYIRTLVNSAAVSYSTNNLEKFDRIFRFSKFSNVIDNADSSILSNVSSLKITRRFAPTTGFVDSWNVKFNNPIAKGTFTSSAFRMQGISNDLYISDSSGVLQVTYLENNIKKVFLSNIGTISYDTGSVSFDSVMFESYTGDYIELTGVPASPDIISVRNTIVMIDPNKVSVSAIVESKDFNDHQFAVTR